MRTYFAVFAATLLFPLTASGHGGQTYGSLSADAPKETAQFGFLIGEWGCKTRRMSPDGSLQDGPDATWTGHYILDGWAIQDNWRSSQPGSMPGTNIRSFNPQTGKWDNRWLPAGTLQWKYYESEQVDDTMVMTGEEEIDRQERKYIDRNIFYEIGDTAWKWRKDRSFDGGKNWIEGVAHIHCRNANAGAKAGHTP